MSPLKCCLCLRPSYEVPDYLKTVLSGFRQSLNKFQSSGLHGVKRDQLTLCKSCWIYFKRVHQLKHQLRFKNEICDATKSFLRSKIRRAQRSPGGRRNLSSCRNFEGQISASPNNDDNVSDASGQTVGDSAEAISCSLNNTDESDDERLESCDTAEFIATDNVPVSSNLQEKEGQDEEDKLGVDDKEGNPFLRNLSAPIEDHSRHSPQVPYSISLQKTDASDVESIELYAVNDGITPNTHYGSTAAKSAEPKLVEATSDDISESFRKSKRPRKYKKRTFDWSVRSSDVKKLSETEFMYLKKYPFQRTDVGFKCGLCPAISNTYKGSLSLRMIESNIIKHMHNWHMDKDRVGVTYAYQRFIEIAPNRFQYGKCKVELIDGHYRCEECGALRVAKTTGHNGAARNIMEHIKRHHENPPRKYVCELCGKVYRYSLSLSEHRASKHENRQFPCSECGKTFVSRIKTSLHERTVHGTKRKFICEICGKECSQKQALQCHIAFVHDGQNIKCDFCDKMFGSQAALNVHRYCHRGKKYSCDICGMDFTQSYSVTRHKKTAHNE